MRLFARHPRRYRHNSIDHTTWEFLRPGWWTAHALLVGGVYLLGRRMGRV